MPRKPLDQEAARAKVCLICLRKSDRKVNPEHIEQIKNSSNLFKNIQSWDQRVPTGICNVCVIDLKNVTDSKKSKDVLKIPKDFCFSKEVLVSPTTRSNSGDTACSCLICQIAKTKPIFPHPYYKVKDDKIFPKGAKRKSEEKPKFLFDNNLEYFENLKRFKQAEPKKPADRLLLKPG